MKRIMKDSFIALSTVLAVGLTACTEEADYMPADLVASDCIKASFGTDGNALIFASTDENKFSIPLTREVTNGESVVLLNPTHLNSSIFQIPESVTFAAGANETLVDVTFTTEGMELEEEYTYSIELEEAAYDPYSENTVSTTTGTVLKQANWDKTLGIAQPNFMYFGTQSDLWGRNVRTECEVLGTSSATTWYKLASPIEEGCDIVLKVNEDGTVRVRQQLIYMADISNLLGYSYPPTPCYVSLNASYTGANLGNGIYGNTYNPANGLIAVVLDYTCAAGTITTGLTSFSVLAAQ